MTKQPTLGNGKICYIEIPATNIAESSAFYREVFNWNVRTRGDGTIAFDDVVGEVSGTWVKGRKPATETGFVIYIMVDSIKDTAGLIESKRGSIISMDLEGKEKIARFSDPFGNIFGLYQQGA